MTSHFARRLTLGSGFLFGVSLGACLLAARGADKPGLARDSDELKRLYEEDQGDRRSEKAIDWTVVGARDKKREARIKELYNSGGLNTGADYFHAAMVLQHGGKPEEYLLAHELCVAAIAKGEGRAKWLAAAAEDRFLCSIGRPQRFATQFKADGLDKPFHLQTLEAGVTDELRRALDVPSLAEARDREKKMNEEFKKKLGLRLDDRQNKRRPWVPRLSLLNRAHPVANTAWSGNVVSNDKSTAEPKRLSRGTRIPG
jgi:hypothetical protein